MGCKHCENCHHEERKNGTKEAIRYVFALILFGMAWIPIFQGIKPIIFLAAILVCSFELIVEGIKNIFHLNFEESTLMTIAVIAAFILGEYPESVLVVLLFKMGEFLEERAIAKSNQNIEQITKMKAETANQIQGKEVKTVEVEKLKIGDYILIKPGEKIPVDVIIEKGNSTLDNSAITGESIPKEVKQGEEILSGGINLTGSLEGKVIRDFKNSTASQIVDLVYEATNNKGKTEKFITKFSKIYTPTVIILAIILAIFPPIFFGGDFTEWIKRSLVFLVASCPCSLVISVPLAFFSCLGAIAKKGMIIKGTKHIENLSKTTLIAFDKTGTLTTGKMRLKEIQEQEGYTKQEILQIIYSLEKRSNHPISTAITQIVENIEEKLVEDSKELSGYGIYGKIEGKEVVFGNQKLLEKYHIKRKEAPEEAICLGVDGKLAGWITLEEEIREENSELVKKFQEIHVKRLIMLTGDSKKAGEKVAKEIGIQEIYHELLPKEKLEIVEKLKKEQEIVTFVGDGINDSPVLAASHFGISMKTGTEIANSTADGILLSNQITGIPDMIKIAKKTMKIVKTNITFSIVLKIFVLVLGILGIAPIWAAVLVDTGLTFLTVMNSLRIFKNLK